MALLLPHFVLQWWKLALGFVLGAVLCFPLAQCRGERIGAQRAALALEKANNEALQQKARADEIAAEQRVTDLVAVNQREQELIDAIQQVPDSVPDAASVRLGCERLRRASPGAPLPPACG